MSAVNLPRFIRTLLLFLGLVTLGAAHVGSPDIYLDGSAGPYKLFVAIRPPQVIPGVAEIEVRCTSPGVREISAAPLPISGAGAAHAPVADKLTRSAADRQFFTGALWLMTDGSWKVRVNVSGAQGTGTLAIPVPAIARTTRGMQWQLGLVLIVLGIFLVSGLTAICGAAVREAKLAAGAAASERNTRQGRIAMLVSFCVIAVLLASGKTWWDRSAAVYTGRVYKPLLMQASLQPSSHGPSELRLDLREPGWMQPAPGRLSRIAFVRKMDDLTLDHGHLMHLYVIRQPGLDVIYHLHPAQVQPHEFQLALPSMPSGDYNLYADVVHANGLPETLTASLHIPAGNTENGRALSGDDAHAEAAAIGQNSLGDTFLLPDGYRMRWLHDAAPLHARQGSEFRFELLAPDGRKPNDMALYMGMLGHAAFVKTDGTVFAHIHPNGTVAMSAFMLAQESAPANSAANHDMPGMAMDNMQDDMQVPNQVSFPYGLPTAGKYRVFVQMKHGSTVETGVFDATAQ